MTEGTWSLPNTKQKAMKLKKILSKPLSAEKAGDVLYDLTGDDSLYDMFDELIADGEGKDDIRYMVVDKVKKWVKDFEKDPSLFKDGFDKDAIKIIKAFKDNL